MSAATPGRRKVVGILGGGQLGAMLARAIFDLGGDVAIYEPEALAPACRQARNVVNASWDDAAALETFFDACDVVTYETEHIETAALKKLAANDKLRPSLAVLETTQHRHHEKQFLADQNLPHAAFVPVANPSELANAAKTVGFPCIAKTARGGYDGKGQFLLRSENDVAAAVAALPSDMPCVVEEALDLLLEASCIVARAPHQTEVVFPIFENMHDAHILDMTLVPARISAEVTSELLDIALQAARALDVTGLLTTEFFLAKPTARSKRVVDGVAIYVNEFAPRPHNSGHVTRALCSSSQFDLLARMLLGAPLTSPRVDTSTTYCMANLLGESWGNEKTTPLDLSAWSEFPDVVEVALYGKRDAQFRRKMGHFVVCGADAEATLARGRTFRARISR
jgi:5-(carboxyamino)imidazole ribonucleotide synthase